MIRTLKSIYNRNLLKLIRWGKAQSFPGFSGIPIYDVLKFVINELRREDITTRANSMAFSFFLALFPAIIFMFTLLPYLPIENFDEIIKSSIQEVMPENAHEFLFETVDQVRSIQHGGLLSVGFLLAIIFASNGILSMISGFEKSYEVSFKERNFFRRRMVALGLTLLVSVLFVLSAAMIIAGTELLTLLFSNSEQSKFNNYLFQFLRWLSILFLFYSIISVLYRFGPPLRKKIAFFSTGTNLATFLCIATSIILTYLMNNFGTQSRIYGPLGALIVMLIWMQANCFILLIGFELNASIAVNRDLRINKQKEDEK